MGHDGVTQKNGVRAERIGASKRPEQTVAQDPRIAAGLKWNALGPTDFGGPAAFGEATDGDGDGNDSRGLSGGFALKMIDIGRSPYSS